MSQDNFLNLNQFAIFFNDSEKEFIVVTLF